MKKGFTLVEILIVVLIFAILSSLLFKTYIAITRVAFRLEQEKNVSDSIVTISRIVQNFADRNTIDYTAYDLSDLEQNDGASDVLHLQWADGIITLWTTWFCASSLDTYMTGTCQLYMTNSSGMIYLTDTWYVNLTQIKFQLIPYTTPNSTTCAPNYFVCSRKPWFWMYTTFFSPYYVGDRNTDAVVPFQLFFTTR